MNHKLQHKWILPTIIKSCSEIYPEDWGQVPAATNGDEGQHYWMKRQTGLHLTCHLRQLFGEFFSAVKFLLQINVQTFRPPEVDQKIANKIWDFEQHGTLVNSWNNLFNHMSHNTQHISTAQQKAAAIKQHKGQTSEIHERTTNKKALHKWSMLWQKGLQAELGSMKSSTKEAMSHTAQSLTFCRAALAGESMFWKQLKLHRLLWIHIWSTAEGHSILPISFNYLTALFQVRAHSRPSMMPTTMEHLVKLQFLSTSILIGTGTYYTKARLFVQDWYLYLYSFMPPALWSVNPCDNSKIYEHKGAGSYTHYFTFNIF